MDEKKLIRSSAHSTISLSPIQCTGLQIPLLPASMSNGDAGNCGPMYLNGNLLGKENLKADICGCPSLDIGIRLNYGNCWKRIFVAQLVLYEFGGFLADVS